MAIRVRVRLEASGGSVEAVALVNSGYESARPEILVPEGIAARLGVGGAEGAEVREYVLADGSTSRLTRYRSAVRVYVLAEDRVVGPVTADLVVARAADEPLISDKLADALMISAVAIGEGLWCFRDELGRRVRRSL